LSVSNSSVTSARFNILVILASEITVELILITSRTSSTDTLAKHTLAPKEKAEEAKFKEFWRKKPRSKNHVKKTVPRNNARAFH